MSPDKNSADVLTALAAVIESRLPAQGGNPEASYVARLLHKGPDAFLKKIGEEATEVAVPRGQVRHFLQPRSSTRWPTCGFTA